MWLVLLASHDQHLDLDRQLIGMPDKTPGREIPAALLVRADEMIGQQTCCCVGGRSCPNADFPRRPLITPLLDD
jgi:hypothetical protein